MHIVLLKSPHVQIVLLKFASRVYSNCSCCCSFEPEIIKISQSSHKMYSNNIANFQESTTILNACTKKVWKLIEYTTYIQKHDGGLITAIRNDTDNTMDNRMTITRKQKWKGKQLYERFKRQINNISHDKTWTWLRKGNFKGETESLLIAAHNNAIRTNHIKARIDKTQQNSKCRQCGDRDETINHIIRECSKLAQKE